MKDPQHIIDETSRMMDNHESFVDQQQKEFKRKMKRAWIIAAIVSMIAVAMILFIFT